MKTPCPSLILASQSPRRRQLLEQAGFPFRVVVPDDDAECGVCSRESPPELVSRLAYQKAHGVARRTSQGWILGCDTVVECVGQILGKPQDRAHARQMLQLLRGRDHHVYSGLCLWRRPDDRRWLEVDRSKLRMQPISDQQLEEYLGTEAWSGKAGAFGFQDGWDWIELVEGSESNVVGLPLELLTRLLAEARLQ